MLAGDGASLEQMPAEDRPDRARFEIHMRNYRTSLTGALWQKYPATGWLMGQERFASVALEYVTVRAPTVPCIAEYGADFPEFLGRKGRSLPWPYLQSLACLDWLIGKASIAVDEPALRWADLAAAGTARLLESRLGLQPGLLLLRARYPVDEIVIACLSGNDVRNRHLPSAETLIQITGSRGRYALAALEPQLFEFRDSLSRGLSIGDAASRALEADRSFDAGQALRGLVDAGLVVSMEGTS